MNIKNQFCLYLKTEGVLNCPLFIYVLNMGFQISRQISSIN